MFTSVSKSNRVGSASAKKVQRWIPEVTVKETPIDSEFTVSDKWDRVRLNNTLIAVSESFAISPIVQDDLGVQEEVGQVIQAALKMGRGSKVVVNLSAFQDTQKARYFVFSVRHKIERQDLRLKVKMEEGNILIVESK